MAYSLAYSGIGDGIHGPDFPAARLGRPSRKLGPPSPMTGGRVLFLDYFGEFRLACIGRLVQCVAKNAPRTAAWASAPENTHRELVDSRPPSALAFLRPSLDLRGVKAGGWSANLGL